MAIFLYLVAITSGNFRDIPSSSTLLTRGWMLSYLKESVSLKKISVHLLKPIHTLVQRQE